MMLPNTNANHHDVANKIEILLKVRRQAIPASRFIDAHTIEGAPVCDISSRVAEVIVTKLRVYATEASLNCSHRHLFSYK